MPNRSAFTLIEVLVVVAVIGLLVAVLIPSLAMAREQGRCVVCAAQLRQLMAALDYYAKDHSGGLPSAEPDGNGNGIHWFMNGYLLRYVKVPVRKAEDGTLLGPPAEDSPLTCPSHEHPREIRPDAGDDPAPCEYALSYAIGVSLGIAGRPRGKNTEYRRRSEFKQPSMTLAFTDSWGAESARGVVAALACPRWNFDFRHGQAVNVVFFDSHVARLRSRQIPWAKGFNDHETVYLPFWNTKKITHQP